MTGFKSGSCTDSYSGSAKEYIIHRLIHLSLPSNMDIAASFFSFEKFKVGARTPGTIWLPKPIKDTYVSHTNRVYEKDGYMYSGSRVVVELDNPNIRLEIEEKVTKKFGWEPDLSKESCYAVYAVIHPSQLSIQEFRTDKQDKAFGRCVMVSGQDVFAFLTLATEMQLSLFLDQETKSDDGLLTLRSATCRQTSFAHAEYEPVVLPGQQVADSLELALYMEEGEMPEVTMTGVKIAFQELSSTTQATNNQVSIKRSYCESPCLDKTMKEKLCFEKQKNGTWKCCVPRSFYQCVLPKLGPTFFTNTQSRTYSIKATVLVECSGVFQDLTVYEEITVASTMFSKKRESCPGPPQRQRGIVHIEEVRMGRVFELEESAKHVEKLRQIGYQYICQRTEAISYDDKVRAVSVITVLPTMLVQYNQEKIPNKLLRSWGLDKFGSRSLTKRSKAMVCEYAPADPPYAKYMLYSGEYLAIPEFSAFTTHGYCYGCTTYSRPFFFNKKNKLVVTFVGENLSREEPGHAVLPNARLTDFLRIELFDTKEQPSRLHIDLHEYIQGDGLKYRDISRTKVLVDAFKPMYEECFMKGYKQLRLVYVADHRAYDVALPSLGASFFTATHSRTYMLTIEVMDREKKYKVWFPLEVARMVVKTVKE